MEYFRKALQLEPGNVNALANMFFLCWFTGDYARDMEKGMKTAGEAKGNGVLFMPILTTTYTYMLLNKLCVMLGAIMLFVMAIHFLPAPFPKDDKIVLHVTVIWLTIVFLNYFPKLFIPLGKLLISFM